MQTVVREINLNNRKTNTRLAYDPKVAEYEAFCDYVYPHVAQSTRYTVDSNRLFKFLFYHSMRNKYNIGGAKTTGHHGFDAADYDRVWQSYQLSVERLRQFSLSGENVPDDVLKSLFKDPEKPIGYDQLNTYKAVVRGVWESQVQSHANSLAWDLILTYECKALLKMVKERRARIRRETYQEKLEGDFTPFTSIGQVSKIEQKFWDNGKRSSRAAFPALRNRMTFLNCYSGVLRHESMFLGELSDMVGLEHERSKDAHAMFIMVMQMSTGAYFLLSFCSLAPSSCGLLLLAVKIVLTNHKHTGKTIKGGKLKQYGRSMRHKDVRQCAVGAFAFYLYFRFHVSREMDEDFRPDFSSNQSWFDVKILTDGTRNNTKEMKKKSYTDDIKGIFRELKMVASHYGHWGRVSAPVELEFAELDPDLIRILGEISSRLLCCCLYKDLSNTFGSSVGNWDPKTQDARYSCKLPIKAIRVIAGFEESETHFNPRVGCEPPKQLTDCIFPWIEEELEKIFEKNDDDGGSRLTAVCVLRFWSSLRSIILQDAAAMFVLYPDRCDHPLFRLALFQDPLFAVSCLCCRCRWCAPIVPHLTLAFLYY